MVTKYHCLTVVTVFFFVGRFFSAGMGCKSLFVCAKQSTHPSKSETPLTFNLLVCIFINLVNFTLWLVVGHPNNHHRRVNFYVFMTLTILQHCFRLLKQITGALHKTTEEWISIAWFAAVHWYL